jgi:hypothetical protein
MIARAGLRCRRCFFRDIDMENRDRVFTIYKLL